MKVVEWEAGGRGAVRGGRRHSPEGRRPSSVATLEELEENMGDAYRLMVLEDVPEQHEIKELALQV